jgi:single-stranded-DNA-specific exonuclease
MKSIRILNKESRIMNHEEIIRVLLENRGVKTKKEVQDFLNPELENVTLGNVGIEKKEVEKSLELIKKTMRDRKAIVVYGDYDVDGICGTAILWETIHSFYKQSLPPSEIKNVHPYIPHRIDEGYGLSITGISNIKSQISNVGLIITVDNGIVANKAVDFAKKLGIKVIITDHHVKSSTLPKADAIVHTTGLCGAGVAYLLSREISNEFSKRKFSNEEKHLELVALATVADLVPLNKYNRVLLKFGLEHLRKTKRLGLIELFSEAKINQSEIGVYEIGHMIAPRLNASGRISHALDSLRLTCTTDKVRAKKLARLLGDINTERQQITLDSSLHAIEQTRNSKLKARNITFVKSEMYEPGVIGLIASRLVEEFYRPAIVVSVGKEISKGSARSIKGVNIIELIRLCSEFLSEAGGHPMAAGFSIKTERLKDFKNKMMSLADKLDNNLFEKVLTVDLDLPFKLISDSLYQQIQKLAPFGMGNPEPVFISRNVTIASIRNVGNDGQHLKLVLQKDIYSFPAIYFRAGDNNFKAGDLIDSVYTISENEWNGKKTIELKIRSLLSSIS